MVRNTLTAKRISHIFANIATNYFSNKLSNPILIIGCARSGTSILVDTLASHPDIATYPDEANILWHPQLFPWRFSKHKSVIPPIEVDPREFTNGSIKYRSEQDDIRLKATFGAYQFVMRKKCFLNKSAMITFMIPYILNIIPETRFIYIIRDGRAVVRSRVQRISVMINNNLELYENQKFGISYEDLLVNCARSWQAQVEEVKAQKKKLGLVERGLLIELKYEDFCKNPNDILYQLARFINVSTQVYTKKEYDHIINMNYKFQDEFNEDQLRHITEIMRPGLKELNYI